MRTVLAMLVVMLSGCGPAECPCPASEQPAGTDAGASPAAQLSYLPDSSSIGEVGSMGLCPRYIWNGNECHYKASWYVKNNGDAPGKWRAVVQCQLRTLAYGNKPTRVLKEEGPVVSAEPGKSSQSTLSIALVGEYIGEACTGYVVQMRDNVVPVAEIAPFSLTPK